MNPGYSILFYLVNKPYGCFSNFAKYPVEIDEVLWPTSEHYYQACKFERLEDKDDVRLAKTPFVAAQIGRDRGRLFRSDWENTKDQIMEKVLKAKFDQHSDFREILLSTGNAVLVEHTANDAYWADGGDGTGRNRLGELLMDLRDSCNPDPRPFFPPPWIMYPDIEVSDMHWRMGAGEGYLIDCGTWFQGLSVTARKEYNAHFPTPPQWANSW